MVLPRQPPEEVVMEHEEEEEVSTHSTSKIVLDASWRADFMDDAIERIRSSGSINGLFHNHNGCIPEEIMEIILSYCSAEDMLNIARVCIIWKTITTSRSFWKLVCARHNIFLDTIPSSIKENPNGWIAFYSFCKNSILTKNFVVNHSGAEGFRGWILQPPEFHGNAFQIEEMPVGCDPLPEDPDFATSSCFVTSYTFATKHQVIDLWKSGLTPAVMKLCAPFELSLSEMISSRFDCGAMGTVNFVLLSVDSDTMQEIDPNPLSNHENFNFPPGSNWQTIKIKAVVDAELLETFDLRSVMLLERGKDTQFWAGNYGPKFARSCIKFKCLDTPHQAVISNQCPDTT